MRIFLGFFHRFFFVSVAFLCGLSFRQHFLASYLGGQSEFGAYPLFFLWIFFCDLYFSWIYGWFLESWNRLSRLRRIQIWLNSAISIGVVVSLIAFFSSSHLFSRTFLVFTLFFLFLCNSVFEILFSRSQKSKTILPLGFFSKKEWLLHDFLKHKGFLFLSDKHCPSWIDAIEKFEPDEVWLFGGVKIEDFLISLRHAGISVKVRDLSILELAFARELDLKRHEAQILSLFGLSHGRHFFWRFKRSLDLFLICLFSPIWIFVFLGICLLLFLTQRQVFFVQSRIGFMGEIFQVYKFCTMRPDQSTEKPKDFGDQRLTILGGFLRRTSLDELPQVLNVILGQMSLVGPRPEISAIAFAKYKAFQWKRVMLMPGITGLWQIHGRKQPIHEHLKYDLYYIKNQSLWLDLYILARTIPAVLSKRGAR